jgi:flagellar hook-length control protein FliK
MSQTSSETSAVTNSLKTLRGQPNVKSTGNGFSVMLQAFDTALTATVGPKPAPQNAPEQLSERSEREDQERQQSDTPTAAKASSRDDKATDRNQTTVRSNESSNKTAEHKVTKPTTDAEKQSDTATEAAADDSVSTTTQTSETAPIATATIDNAEMIETNPYLAAQLAVTHPKIMASQKAMPVTMTPQTDAIPVVAATLTTENNETANAETLPDVNLATNKADTATAATNLLQASVKPTIATGLSIKGATSDEMSDSKILQQDITASGMNALPRTDDKPNLTAHGPDPLAANTPSPAQIKADTMIMPNATLIPLGKLNEAHNAAQNRQDANKILPLELTQAKASFNHAANVTGPARSSNHSGLLKQLELTEQVAVKIHQQAKNGVEQMTLQLRPADMGRIDIKLNFHDGAVTGLIIADQQATLDLLRRDQGVLERAMQESGLRTDSGSLSFQLRDQSSQTKDLRQNSGNGKAKAQDFTLDVASLTNTDAAETAIITTERVNLRI